MCRSARPWRRSDEPLKNRDQRLAILDVYCCHIGDSCGESIPVTLQTVRANVSSRFPAVPLALVNARIWTGDSRRPWANALLTADEHIAVVGSAAEVMKRGGSNVRVIDAQGAF